MHKKRNGNMKESQREWMSPYSSYYTVHASDWQKESSEQNQIDYVPGSTASTQLSIVSLTML